MSKKIELHVHTNHSDGAHSPRELCEIAKKEKVDVLAITDHDTVSAIDEFEYYNNGKIELIPGVEITCRIEGHIVHILGYFVDPNNVKLNEFLKKINFNIHENSLKKIQIINDSDLPLLFHTKKLEQKLKGIIRNSHIMRLIQEKGYNPGFIKESLKQEYAKFNIDNIDDILPSYKDAIKIIRHAGGVAVLAHVFRYKWMRTEEEISHFFQKMADVGLCGVEFSHEFYQNKGRDNKEKFKNHVTDICDREGLILTGGSDFHGINDPNKRILGSMNITDNVIEKLKKCIPVVKK